MDADTPQEQVKPDPVLDLNFVPTWAREAPGSNPYAHFESREREGRGPYRDRRGERPSGKKPGERRDRPGGAFPDRRRGPPRRDEGGRDSRPAHPPPSEPRVEFERVPVEIGFIPERLRLGALVQDLRTSGRAYPLSNLAARFLSNPAFYLVKLEARSAGPGRPPVNLFQCKDCKLVFLDAGSARAHAKAAHLDAFFDKEQVESEPPAGNFVCVARCRLSGILLGPPNHHGYNEKVQDLWRTRFPHMTLDEYRSRIETVREPELIEKWKQETRTQVVYRLRGQADAPPLKPAEAERYFVEHAAPSFVAQTHRAILPAEQAQRIEDARLKFTLREAWSRESHRPYSLMLALRPAFTHMHLHLFKTRGDVTFVTRIQPAPIRPEQAVQPIAGVLTFLREHPGCTRQGLVDQLRPGAAPDSPEVSAVISPLRWLIEKGHVIEFFNGTLSVPTARRAPNAPGKKENRAPSPNTPAAS